MTIWQILEMEATHDKKTIKKAYAKMIKKYHPEEHPKEYETIRQAYEKAIEFANMIAQIQTENDHFEQLALQSKREQDRLFLERMRMEYPDVVNELLVDFSQLDRETGRSQEQESMFDSMQSFQEKYNRYQKLYIQPQLESRRQSEQTEIKQLDFWKARTESRDVEANLLYIAQMIPYIDDIDVLHYLYTYTSSIRYYYTYKKKVLKALRHQFGLLYLSQKDKDSLKKWNVIYSMILPFFYVGILITFIRLLSQLSQSDTGAIFYLVLLLFLDMLVRAGHFRKRMNSLVIDVKRYRSVQSGLMILSLFLIALNFFNDSPHLLARPQNFESFLVASYAMMLLLRFLNVVSYDIMYRVYLGSSMPVIKFLGFLFYTGFGLLTFLQENVNPFVVLIALLPILLGIRKNRVDSMEEGEYFFQAIISIPLLTGLKKYLNESGDNWYLFLEAVAHFLVFSSFILGFSYITDDSSIFIDRWIIVSFVLVFLFSLLNYWIRSYQRRAR